MSEKENAYSFETLQIHAGQENPDPATDARAVPIYLTSSFVFKDAATAAGRFGLTEPGNIYSRLTNPTVSIFEERIAALEGGVGALGVATGSAAITVAVQNIATVGRPYRLLHQPLRRHAQSVRAHPFRTGTLHHVREPLPTSTLSEAAIQDNTKLLYAETLGNPNSDVRRHREAGPPSRTHNHSARRRRHLLRRRTCVRPLEHGADVVGRVRHEVHRRTWHGDGRRDHRWRASSTGPATPTSSLASRSRTRATTASCSPKPQARPPIITKARATLLRDQGATLSPFNAFILLLQGLETSLSARRAPRRERA